MLRVQLWYMGYISQALEKRTAELKAKTEELNKVLKRLEAIERKLIILKTVNDSKRFPLTHPSRPLIHARKMESDKLITLF